MEVLDVTWNGQRRGNGRLRRRLARAPEAVAGRPVGLPLPWERRASQSSQARPEEAQEPTSCTCQGGHFDHAVSPKSQNLSWMSSSCVSSCSPVRMISHPSTAARVMHRAGVRGQAVFGTKGGAAWAACRERGAAWAAASASTLHTQSCGREQVGRACGGGRARTFLRPLDAAALLYRLKLTALLHRRRRALSTPPLQPALG